MGQVQQLPAVFVEDRLLPQSIDLEDAILGGLLVDGDAFMRIEFLRQEHFYLNQNQIIFGVMQAIRATNGRIDLMTVVNQLTQSERLDAIGGKNRLVNLYESTIGTANIDGYANLVVSKWRRREMIRRCQALISLAHSADVPESELQSSLDSSLLDLFSKQGDNLVDLNTAMLESFDRLESLESAKLSPTIPTGYQSLDRLIGGVTSGQLIIVAGRPSMGKSALAVSGLTRNIATSQKRPSLVFSLEMSRGQLVERIWSSEMDNPHPLRVKSMNSENWADLGRATSKLAGVPIYLDDTPGMDLAHIQSVSRQAAAALGQLGCITIDYLQIMETGDGENMSQILGRITKRLKHLARELNVPIFLLSQLNRGVESRNDKRPLMSDLRESGSIEQDSDIVMMLYRDEYYDQNSSDRGTAEIIIRKNRDGPLGVVKLVFEPHRSRFYDTL